MPGGAAAAASVAGNGEQGTSAPPEPTTSLYVSNLDWGTTDDDLFKHFCTAGASSSHRACPFRLGPAAARSTVFLVFQCARFSFSRLSKSWWHRFSSLTLTPLVPPRLSTPGASPASAKVQVNEKSGRSKGWGLVVFSTVEDAERAKEALNKSDLDGRPISVRFDAKGGASA